MIRLYRQVAAFVNECGQGNARHSECVYPVDECQQQPIVMMVELHGYARQVHQVRLIGLFGHRSAAVDMFPLLEQSGKLFLQGIDLFRGKGLVQPDDETVVDEAHGMVDAVKGFDGLDRFPLVLGYGEQGKILAGNEAFSPAGSA
jgi:hypothetical protein